jgi:NADPH:quinone reductase-like Zn-dependent oxidoreductase
MSEEIRKWQLREDLSRDNGSVIDVGSGGEIKAVRIQRFGGPEQVALEDVPVPVAGAGEILVHVRAAGVAPWDALIREGKSKVSSQPPLTLGSDLAGVVEAVGANVVGVSAGDEVYGVTNPQFCGAQAEYAVAQAGMIAPKPKGLDFLQAASAPVIAVAAWQMLFDYARVKRGDAVMILGAAGNVGAYASQMALNADLSVVAVARARDAQLLHSLGVESIVDSDAPNFERELPPVDAILDTVGASTLERCLGALKAGGRVVSIVSSEPPPQRSDVQVLFFYAEVTTSRLEILNTLFEEGTISARVGSVLPLAEAREGHRMLAGAPHQPGKIVLQLS